MGNQSSTSPPAGPASLFSRLRAVGAADLILALCVVSAIGLLIVKVPTWLMDILLVTNFTISIVVLLVALLSPDARRLPAFPTVLLLTTLARLALNVSSTRLILLDADAGRVVEAFGRQVVGQSVVVGAVIFLVLIIVQFVVVAKGAERVAEVAARFTLDAMPGKQMSVEADVRAGLMSPDQAREKRNALERESRLYGAMDGAMKFVKGDAIAGIIISLINVIGGLIIAKTAAQPAPALAGRNPYEVFPLLTIGDGLCAQIPSILTSIAAGLVVTRVASTENAPVGRDLASQFLLQPRALAIVGSMMLLFAALGFPPAPFLLMGFVTLAAAGLITWRSSIGPPRVLAELGSNLPRREATPAPLQLLLAEINADLATPALRMAVQAAAVQVGQDLGISVPVVQVATSAGVPPGGIAYQLFDAPMGVFERASGDLLAHAPSQLARLLRQNAPRFAGITGTHQMLERIRATDEGVQLVRAVTPNPLTLQQVSEVLQRLLREDVPIRQLPLILESLAKWGATIKNPQYLAERCRRDLAAVICGRIAPAPGELHFYTLAPEFEDLVRSGVEETLEGQSVALSLEDRRSINAACRAGINLALHGRSPPVLLVENAALRRPIRSVLEREMPDLVVLCYEEIPRDVLTKTLGVIGLSPASPEAEST